MTIGKAHRIDLECDHVLWLKPPFPHLGETLYCTRCRAYRTVGPGHARTAPTYHPDYDWKSYPLTKGFRGECLFKDCGYQLVIRLGFYQLKERMESHHLHQHAESSLIIHAEIVPIPDSKRLTNPPF